MNYYVVCINKSPSHSDPRHRITALGTSEARGANKYSRKWSADEVIRAIDSRLHTFYCTDKRGDLVKVVTVSHNGGKYLKTENDGITQDNLLSQPECA